MSDQAVRTLQQLREREVEDAKEVLAQAKLAALQAEQLLGEAALRLERATTDWETACVDDEPATCRDLIWSERHRRRLRLALSDNREQLRKAEALQASVRERLRSAESQMREAEFGRRAASHVLVRREAARERMRELREEEQATEGHRQRRR